MPPAKKSEEERKFKDKLTIEDLEKVGIKSPMELQELQNNWDGIIKLLNALLISGPKITKKIDIKELNKMQEEVSKAFL